MYSALCIQSLSSLQSPSHLSMTRAHESCLDLFTSVISGYSNLTVQTFLSAKEWGTQGGSRKPNVTNWETEAHTSQRMKEALQVKHCLRVRNTDQLPEKAEITESSQGCCVLCNSSLWMTGIRELLMLSHSCYSWEEKNRL